MDPKQIIYSDPDILGGAPVFAGTRVPVDALIDFLEGGDTIEDFLENYPGVSRSGLCLSRGSEPCARGEDGVKRVLFDENLPRLLRRKLPEFEIRTVQEQGWGSLKNGDLLRRAEGDFDVLLTADRRMQYQQKLTSFAIGVVVIITPRLQLSVLAQELDAVRTALSAVRAGEIMEIRIA